jgi:hypothetical protein
VTCSGGRCIIDGLPEAVNQLETLVRRERYVTTRLLGEVAKIDTSRCASSVRTREYDYSCTQRDVLDLKRRIAGIAPTVMPGHGRFPMSEDYAGFMTHLAPVLEDRGNRNAERLI